MSKKGHLKRDKQALPADAPVAVAPPSRPSPILSFLERHCLAISLALVLLASLRIVATYNVFNHTCDEGAHIACGLEWIQKGTYTLEAQHPPLARVFTAMGPYLLGNRMVPAARSTLMTEGAAVLSSAHRYDASVSLARLGVLPFFWVGCVVVYLWGRRYFSGAVAALAVLLFSFLPPVLAHAGLATTDMALTAFMGAAFLSGYIWLEEPTPAHTVWFGVCTALMVLSKFSGLVFLPVSMAVALLWYLATARPGMGPVMRALRRRLPSFGLAVLLGCFVIWAGYRFSFGKVDFTSLRLPAPELYTGIEMVRYHNDVGHQAYLLGMRSLDGWWYFYEVALAVKTPLGFLALLIAGVVLAFRNRLRDRQLWPALLFSFGVLLVGAFSRINIGIRHVLPIYLGFSIVAAVALARAIENRERGKWMFFGAAAMVAWMAVSSLIAHPDYLPYFNELAGGHPENILVDSDLDWGQDLKRLSARLKQVGAKEVSFITPFAVDLESQLGFPPHTPIHPASPAPGWNAVELTFWKSYRLGLIDRFPDGVLWPDRVPRQQLVGKSVLLYYFPYPSEALRPPN